MENSCAKNHVHRAAEFMDKLTELDQKYLQGNPEVARRWNAILFEKVWSIIDHITKHGLGTGPNPNQLEVVQSTLERTTSELNDSQKPTVFELNAASKGQTQPHALPLLKLILNHLYYDPRVKIRLAETMKDGNATCIEEQHVHLLLQLAENRYMEMKILQDKVHAKELEFSAKRDTWSRAAVIYGLDKRHYPGYLGDAGGSIHHRQQLVMMLREDAESACVELTTLRSRFIEMKARSSEAWDEFYRVYAKFEARRYAQSIAQW